MKRLMATLARSLGARNKSGSLPFRFQRAWGGEGGEGKGGCLQDALCNKHRRRSIATENLEEEGCIPGKLISASHV